MQKVDLTLQLKQSSLLSAAGRMHSLRISDILDWNSFLHFFEKKKLFLVYMYIY